MTTDEERALLEEYAYKSLTEDGWYLKGSSTAITHSEQSALDIIRACLILGVRVTDILTADAWWKLIQRVTDIDARLSALEGKHDDR
jgi:hypothetical protein